MSWLTLATEDELSEKVGLRLAGEVGLEVGTCLRRNGFGYLKSRISNFCQMARQHPVLLITDLDQKACASGLMNDWLGELGRPDNLVFRIAVREVESWLLADHEAMRILLGPKGTLPFAPDNLIDPKQALLTLAMGASRDVKEDLLAQRGSIASQGIGYNARLGDFGAIRPVLIG